MTTPDSRLFSEACERNREPIAGVLARFVRRGSLIVEIGSGSGQHAAHLSQSVPDVVWQPTERGADHESIRAWTSELSNVCPPLSFDLFDESPPVPRAPRPTMEGTGGPHGHRELPVELRLRRRLR